MELSKPPKLLLASILKGDKVTNAKDEDLGIVEEIMLTLKGDGFAQVAMSFGRVNWMPNDKQFAVPQETLTISFHNKKFILNVSDETLKSAQGFDRDKWPDIVDFEWLAKEFPVPTNVPHTNGRDPYWR